MMRTIFLIGKKARTSCQEVFEGEVWGELSIGKTKGEVLHLLIPREECSVEITFVFLEKMEKSFINKVMNLLKSEPWETIIINEENYFSENFSSTSRRFFHLREYGMPMWYYRLKPGINPISILFS